jgi:hypothetical protein
VLPSTYRGVYVSYYLGNIQSIRDVDAKALFPPQLTSTEKKAMRKARALPLVDDSVVQPAFMEPAPMFTAGQANGHSAEHCANGDCPVSKPGPDTDEVQPRRSKRIVNVHSA